MHHPCATPEPTIIPDCLGADRYRKSSHPVHYGCHTEVRTEKFVLHYDRRGQIKRIIGTGSDWPHPAEWLKRTLANRWVYYSTGSYYAGVFDLLGEYYLPCPDYPTNSPFKENPFARTEVREALALAESLPRRFSELAALAASQTMPAAGAMAFLHLAERQTPRQLQRDTDTLATILGAAISVLPPDSRHVDYDVLPLIVSEGCLYRCAFCSVKSPGCFAERDREEIAAQLRALKRLLGAEIANYNSVFLGQHDALAVSDETLLFAATEAYGALDIAGSFMQGPRLFFFGSVDSLLGKDEGFFQALNRLPWRTHINIGLESFDEVTLLALKKPVPAAKVRQAFERIMVINRQFARVEISANFVLGEALPESHLRTLGQALSDRRIVSTSRTTVYLSPLMGSAAPRNVLDQFREIKRTSLAETYLYLIQRL